MIYPSFYMDTWDELNINWKQHFEQITVCLEYFKNFRFLNQIWGQHAIVDYAVIDLPLVNNIDGCFEQLLEGLDRICLPHYKKSILFPN